ncbi:flavodoxin [Sinanaerobacter chloroacetimidivorans]|jgi:flavodoxin I|uniref:Flavodoxin n=1 Tax=Sinanaerobacter chloroacetimidivorans TaxID=2818044 RepID=A0A8J8B3X1_9FIRM|nr:flavodoxin [Sinanaerobacter chloroacetimidivorans]MBR0600206.1 flavodoxin [Sinanaerobacter chloroacetimidivorans]
MGKAAVIYWSGTGNTQAMAEAVYEGLKAGGDQAAELFSVDKFDPGKIEEYSKLALGCPSMGAEVLEESEFEPFFEAIEQKLKGKKIALFGSYGWGDGEWMRDWYERTAKTGAMLYAEGLIINETPDSDGLEACRNLGRGLAAY